MRSEPPGATSRLTRRSLLGGVVGLAASPLHAQETRFFRIGTGSVSGTYYPIGSLIADVISNPVGSRPCERGGNCGVPGLVAINQSSEGSIANIVAIEAGDIESGFAQSDVAYGAFNGTGAFEGRSPARKIRALANLYPESVHLVVRDGAGIGSVRDLAGKRVSLDREGSGTRVDARLVLEAFGLSEAALSLEDVDPGVAIDLTRSGELDAFFLVAGAPASGVSELADDGLITLVPVTGPEVTRLIERYPFFASTKIASGTYRQLPEIETISVGAQWLVSVELEAGLVHDIARALWRPEAHKVLAQGHPRGRDIAIDHALDGVAIPLHPGAEAFYREVGLIR